MGFVGMHAGSQLGHVFVARFAVPISRRLSETSRVSSLDMDETLKRNPRNNQRGHELGDNSVISHEVIRGGC